jgi:hypothetical protein
MYISIGIKECHDDENKMELVAVQVSGLVQE